MHIFIFEFGRKYAHFYFLLDTQQTSCDGGAPPNMKMSYFQKNRYSITLPAEEALGEGSNKADFDK